VKLFGCELPAGRRAAWYLQSRITSRTNRTSVLMDIRPVRCRGWECIEAVEPNRVAQTSRAHREGVFRRYARQYACRLCRNGGPRALVPRTLEAGRCVTKFFVTSLATIPRFPGLPCSCRGAPGGEGILIQPLINASARFFRNRCRPHQNRRASHGKGAYHRKGGPRADSSLKATLKGASSRLENRSGLNVPRILTEQEGGGTNKPSAKRFAERAKHGHREIRYGG